MKGEIRLRLESEKITPKIVRFSKSSHSNWLTWEATPCYQSDHCFGLIHGHPTIAIHCVLGRGVEAQPHLCLDNLGNLKTGRFPLTHAGCCATAHPMYNQHYVRHQNLPNFLAAWIGQVSFQPGLRGPVQILPSNTNNFISPPSQPVSSQSLQTFPRYTCACHFKTLYHDQRKLDYTTKKTRITAICKKHQFDRRIVLLYSWPWSWGQTLFITAWGDLGLDLGKYSFW